MAKDFDGDVVVVTGASSGLGRAIAIGAAERGAKAVVINFASSRGAAEETAAAVAAAGAEPVLVQGDVGEDEACKAIAGAAARFGRVDALFNNAGVTVFAPNHADLDAVTGDDFLRLYRVNVVGAFQMIRAARPLMEASPHATAAVLNVSSIAASAGIGSSVPYAASKGALTTLTLSLARALAPKIRVNAICPGFIDTPWFEKSPSAAAVDRLRAGVEKSTPLQVASKAEDIADAALFFAAPASRHVTGETLLVDAGTHLGFGTLSLR
jgi:3-oxoacyl-[acyl-carrier protein] reductase